MNEDLITRFQSLNIALNDLAQLLADEDHGAGYVKRLASESDRLFLDLLIVLSDKELKAA